MEVCKPAEFALYRGEKFISVGTVPQIANETGFNIGHLYRLASGKRKTKKEMSLTMIKIEEDEDE